MGRTKAPVFAQYKMFGFTTQHDFHYHVVGVLKNDVRLVTIGMNREEAEKLHTKLGEALANDEVVNETDTVQR